MSKDVDDKNELGITSLYHGTTNSLWNNSDQSISTLYLTKSCKDAEIYAENGFIYEYEDNPRVKMAILKISPRALSELLRQEGVELDPDWGWVDAQENEAKYFGREFHVDNITWRDSFNACGCVSIAGFKDEHKKYFKPDERELGMEP